MARRGYRTIKKVETKATRHRRMNDMKYNDAQLIDVLEPKELQQKTKQKNKIIVIHIQYEKDNTPEPVASIHQLNSEWHKYT